LIRSYPKFEIDKKILEKREWREFSVNELFNIKNSKPYHKKDLDFSKKELPYITRTNLNNGVEDLVKKEDTFIINPKNSIVFGAENAKFFFEPFEYITGNKMYVVTIKNLDMNKFNGLFLVTAFDKSVEECGFGYGQGLTGTREKRRKILLPINENNQSDFDFMEQFIKEIEEFKLKRYLAFIEDELKNLEYKEIPKLQEKEWRDFKIEAIFKVSKGSYLHQKNIIQNGKIPYITAQTNNNGVKLFIGNEPNFKGNSITIEKVNLTAFYQPYDFYCSHDVSVIQHDKLNKYNALFIASMIRRQGFKYSYGRQAQMNVVKRETLFCPVKNNQPDFEYMEQFIKNMIIEKYQKFKRYKFS